MKNRRRETFETQVKNQIKNSKVSAPFLVCLNEHRKAHESKATSTKWCSKQTVRNVIYLKIQFELHKLGL
jgi:hypothetical protein